MIEPLFAYVSNFVVLTDYEKQRLISAFKTKTCLKGTFLERESKIAQRLYFLNNGFVRVFSSEDGIEITKHIAEKNSFITAFNSFVSGATSDENIQCISDCQVLSITKSDYDTLTNESISWNAFCKKVYEKIISYNNQRTNDLLSLSAEKRYKKLLNERPAIIQNVSVQHIASYIGIKPESLSRIRKKIIS